MQARLILSALLLSTSAAAWVLARTPAATATATADRPASPAAAASAEKSVVQVPVEAPMRADDPLLGLRLTKAKDGADVYYAPKTGTPFLYLHGMCGHPMHMCPWLRDALPDGTAMVCPGATKSCGPGAHIWSGTPESRARAIDLALQASGHASDRGVIVGFSQGGYLAADLLRLRPGKYKSAWIVGADPKIDAKALRDAGVERLVLSAGDFDGTAPGLRETARSLAAKGFAARYVSLGRVGHAFPLDATPGPDAVLAWLDDATDWQTSKVAAVPRAIVPELLVRQ